MTASEIAQATGGRLLGRDGPVEGMSFDSRSLTAGQLFVPIVADRDGHDFLPAAVAAGAGAYLSAGPTVTGDVPAILVDDTLEALGRLAAHVRGRLPDRVVGITGSVGKTSCKDLTAAVVARRWRTAASVRSYNNDQGLPHTLLNAPDDAEAVVVEMGMRGFGEIARLCAVARPTIGVITAIGPAHSERLGGIEGVVRAKGELVESLPSDGWAVLNADQPEVMACRQRTSAQVLTFGFGGDVRIEGLVLDESARARFRLATPAGSVPVALGIPGVHMAANAAAAATVGVLLDVPLDAIADALGTASLSPWRMELRRLPGGLVLLNDAYNANPQSMRAALDTLAALDVPGRRVALLGVMAEIEDPRAEHLAIAAYARDRGIEVLAAGTPLYGLDPVDDVLTAVASLAGGDALLVKGSRVAGLERVAAGLQSS